MFASPGFYILEYITLLSVIHGLLKNDYCTIQNFGRKFW